MTAEIERQLANLIRIGRVKEVDAAKALVKLEIGGLTTDWLSWGTARAGTTRSWSAPTVGEQRVLLSPYGDMSQGVIGPAIFQDDHAAPANSGDQEHVVFPDGSTVDYNSATNTLTVTVAAAGNVVINCKHATLNAADDVTVNTKTATVNASSGVTVDTPLAHFTNAVTVDGMLTYGGGLTGKPGAAATMKGNLSLTGDYASTGGMTNNGKQVGSNLRVTGVQSGGSTSGPTA